MKKKRLIAIAVGVLVLWFVGRQAARWALQEAAGPTPNEGDAVIELGESDHFFGTVDPGSSLTHQFKLRNTGNRRLILVEEVCACAKDKENALIVPPGEQIDLALTLKAPAENVVITLQRRFTTNDPKRPRFALTVSAKVETGAARSTRTSQQSRRRQPPGPGLADERFTRQSGPGTYVPGSPDSLTKKTALPNNVSIVR